MVDSIIIVRVRRDFWYDGRYCMKLGLYRGLLPVRRSDVLDLLARNMVRQIQQLPRELDVSGANRRLRIRRERGRERLAAFQK